MDLEKHDFYRDIRNVSHIPIVSTLLDVVCQTTGMGFAAIARVTENRWVTCSVLDNLAFGLVPGAELEIRTTICDEIRASETAVIIDSVDEDPKYCDHHTPKMYGFKSYISMPIHKKDGSFFGTLCAIDPKPNKLNTPAVIGMFKLFTELIAFHLHVIEQLEYSESKLVEERSFSEKLELEVLARTRELETKNEQLEQKNSEIKSFAFISSHDLQEPLRKIQALTSRIAEKEQLTLSDYAKDLFSRIGKSAKRMQSLINDLLVFSNAEISDQSFKPTSLHQILEEVRQDFEEEFQEKGVILEVGNLGVLKVIPLQFRQVFYNLISNALKFSMPGRTLVIRIQAETRAGKQFIHKKLSADTMYCHITVADNGMGFGSQHQEKIFELFQRLNRNEAFAGTGLGLAIVKKIVQNHSGFVTATGKLNEGASFDIYVPMTL